MIYLSQNDFLILLTLVWCQINQHYFLWCQTNKRYFWRTKCKLTKAITERCFSCQNKSVCKNLAQSTKNENRLKKQYTPFLHESLQLWRIHAFQETKSLCTWHTQCSRFAMHYRAISNAISHLQVFGCERVFYSKAKG